MAEQRERWLVTGIAGVIGRHLSSVTPSGVEIHGIVRGSVPKFLIGQSASNTIFHRANLSDAEAVGRIIGEVKPDVVVNLAGYTKNDPKLGEEVYKGNMEIVGNLIKGLERIGSRRFLPVLFIQAGSTLVLGRNTGEKPVEEPLYDQLLEPKGDDYYVRSKIAAGRLLLKAWKEGAGIDSTTLLLANHTGEGRPSGMVECVGIESILKVQKGFAENIEIRNAKARIDLSYAGDGARAIVIARQKAIPGEIYIVARGEDYSIEEILRIMARQSGLPDSVRIVSTQAGEETFARFNVGKMGNLGYKARVSLEVTLAHLLTWYIQQDKDIVGEVQTAYSRPFAVA